MWHRVRIEAVRQAIAAAEFEVSTSVTPIKASISFGIAERNRQGSADEIIHDADVTLYRSKLMGLNVTCIYSLDKIDQLVDNVDQEGNDQPVLPKNDRITVPQFSYQSNPLREKSNKTESAPNLV